MQERSRRFGGCDLADTLRPWPFLWFFWRWLCKGIGDVACVCAKVKDMRKVAVDVLGVLVVGGAR